MLSLARLIYIPNEERERTWWELGIDKKEKKKKKRVIKQERYLVGENMGVGEVSLPIGGLDFSW